MGLSAKQVLQRLGPAALARALDDLLDPGQLVKLANACGLKYPGMRTQSQKRERLLADLVDRAAKKDNVRKAILRTLTKETADAVREWTGLDPTERARRLCDDTYLMINGRVGLHLFLLASTEEAGALDGQGVELGLGRLRCILSNGASPDAGRKAARDESRLRRQVAQREKKIRHLEAQLTKSREGHKVAKSDLIQRKGELAESRMLVERLRQELAQARTAAQVASAGKPDAPASDKTLASLATAVRKVAAEQKKLAHRVAKASAPPPAAGDDLREALAGIAGDLAAQAREHKQEVAGLTRGLEALRADLRAAPSATAAARRTKAKKARKAKALPRVGVFIDVQNVYYAARQLKGKLDFDALLQAAVLDRRLIRATAYVVESKETDQSQFIARLEQRAIDVQRKTVRVRADGSMKGDWDMELALDVLDAAPRLDVVVLVSGDGDFTSLVQRVKAIGPRVEVIAFPRNAAKALVEAADHFQPLDRKFMIYTRKKKATPAATGPAEDGPAAPAKAAASKAKAAAPAPDKRGAG